MFVSELDLSDGNSYTVTCRMSAGQRFATGFSQGTGNNIITGCNLMPGDYRARWNSGVLSLEVFDGKKKAKEIKFDVIATAKHDEISNTKPVPSASTASGVHPIISAEDFLSYCPKDVEHLSLEDAASEGVTPGYCMGLVGGTARTLRFLPK